jgi:hypothetical protein
MSNWKLTELFIERSNAQRSAFAVGVAIAFLGNRKDDGWTTASLDRITLLAHLENRGTMNLAIRELVELGELGYVPGRSRFNPSRYRIRVEVLRDGIDRLRCPLHRTAFPHGDHMDLPHRDRTAFPHSHHTDLPTPPYGISARDHTDFPPSPYGTFAWSISQSSDQMVKQSSDQSARDDARIRDDASKDAGVEQKQSDVVALKTVLEDCRRSAHGSAGGDDLSMPNPTPPSPLADAHSGDDYWQRQTAADEANTTPGDSALKLGDAWAQLPPGWVEQDDAHRRALLEAAQRRRDDFARSGSTR